MDVCGKDRLPIKQYTNKIQTKNCLYLQYPQTNQSVDDIGTVTVLIVFINLTQARAIRKEETSTERAPLDCPVGKSMGHCLD